MLLQVRRAGAAIGRRAAEVVSGRRVARRHSSWGGRHIAAYALGCSGCETRG